MNKKYAIISGVGLISAIAFLFLPLISFSAGGETMSISFMDILKDDNSKMGWFDILNLITSVVLILSIVIKKKAVAAACSIIGACWLFASLGDMSEALSAFGISATDIMGVGFWIALVGFVLNIVLSFALKED